MDNRHNWVAMVIVSVIILSLVGCKKNAPQRLPIYGEKFVENGDTTYHTIPAFSFLNQDSSLVSNGLLSDGVYVADFFFTHCPTICPVVTRQMLKIHDAFIDSSDLFLVSYTLDPKRDTIGRLKDYANKLEVSSDKWHFLTGTKSDIWDLADDYFSIAIDDDEAPGGINHSGKLLLIDKKGRIRAFCEGTIEEEVDGFIKQIETLLEEYR